MTAKRVNEYLFRQSLRQIKELLVFRHTSAEARFTEIYKRNYWASKESVSGCGSNLSATENLRKQLPVLFRKFRVGSVFDAPCGDFNWMRHVLKETQLNYIGADVVAPLIESLSARYQTSTTKFIHLDLTNNRFPMADLMICRDCLFHLSYEDARSLLRNFADSQIPYLLTTTHINSKGFANRDIVTGQFREIDLFAPPYNFSRDSLFRIPDTRGWKIETEMCLWSREQVSLSLGRIQPSIFA